MLEHLQPLQHPAERMRILRLERRHRGREPTFIARQMTHRIRLRGQTIHSICK